MLTITRTRVACAAIVAVPFVAGCRAPDTEPVTRSELLAYEARFVAIAKVVGEVIEGGPATHIGIKRAIGAVDRGERSGDSLSDDVDVWLRVLDRARRDVEQLPQVAGKLADAGPLFLRSIAQYRLAALALRGASGDVAAIDRELDRVIDFGRRGDGLFDDASALIQSERRRLGLEPSADLPDPARPLPPGVTIEDAP